MNNERFSFFVINEEGTQVSEDFTTFAVAQKFAKILSKSNENKIYEVSFAMQTTRYMNGKLLDE